MNTAWLPKTEDNQETKNSLGEYALWMPELSKLLIQLFTFWENLPASEVFMTFFLFLLPTPPNYCTHHLLLQFQATSH
jgi:hypothetical protein